MGVGGKKESRFGFSGATSVIIKKGPMNKNYIIFRMRGSCRIDIYLWKEYWLFQNIKKKAKQKSLAEMTLNDL